MRRRPPMLRRLAYGLVGALLGMVIAYASIPRSSLAALDARHLAAQNMARFRLEQVAAQLQVAAELAHGMAAVAEHVVIRSRKDIEHLVNTFSARNRVDAATAWGVSDLDACRPQHCVIVLATGAERQPSLGMPDTPLRGFTQAQAMQTINTGTAHFLIDNDTSGIGPLVTVMHGYTGLGSGVNAAVTEFTGQMGAAFVTVDLGEMARQVFGDESGTRLLVAEHQEAFPMPATGQQQVMRSHDGIVLAAYYPVEAAQLAASSRIVLWLAIIAASMALAWVLGMRNDDRLRRNAVVACERDAMHAINTVLMRLSSQNLLLCDMKSGNVITGTNEFFHLSQVLVRPAFTELQALTSKCSLPLTVEKVRLRVFHDHFESGALTVAPMDQLGEAMVVLNFESRSRVEELEEQVQSSQRDDALTGLLSRHAFIKRLTALIGDEARPSFAMVGLEVASLGMINALHGLESGDLVLQRIAQRLLVNSRDLIFAGRVEDDLLACVWAVPVPEVVADRINKISAVVRDKPVMIRHASGEVSIEVDAWVAATFVARKAWCDHNVLLSRLGEALSRSRTSALRTHLFSFDGAQLSDRAGDAAWLERIRQAMRDKSLVLFGQKVIPNASSDLVPHAEILLRMRAADGSIIPPGAFLPIAERYELIRELDRYVVARVFRNLEALIQQFAAPDGVIAINLSARTLSDPSLLGFLMDELSETGIDPSKVCLEVTESAAFGDLDWTCNLIAEIRRLGLRVAIDDFGVGMASFSYLQRVPADYVKIDGSFVKDMTSNVLNRRIVQAVTDIGHAVKMHVIAEWVASAEIRDMLEDIGVDYLQGFHLHVPQIAAFEEIVDQRVQLLTNPLP